MSLPAKKKKIISVLNERKIREIVDNLSDLSDLDSSGDEESITSHSSSYLHDADENIIIEKRLEQLFGIELADNENYIEITQEDAETKESLLNVLGSQSSAGTPAPSNSSAVKLLPASPQAESELAASMPSPGPSLSAEMHLPALAPATQASSPALKSPAQASSLGAGTELAASMPSSIPSLSAEMHLPASEPATQTSSAVREDSSPPRSESAASMPLVPCPLPPPPLVQPSSSTRSHLPASTPSAHSSSIIRPDSIISRPSHSSARPIRRDSPRQWKIVDEIHAVPNFDKKIQPLSQYNHKTQPITIFNNFFPESIIALIVEETNRYAIQKQSKNWTNVSPEEIKAFLGILIMMGLHPLPDMELYWSTDPFYNNPEISKVMPLNRYKKITENLHLCNNNDALPRTSPDYDRLFKLRQLIVILNDVFQKETANSSTQSIDECMVKFKGRSSMRQYMPKKPVKRGFKIWARCDSKSGYIYEFEVYTGKGDSMENEGLGYNIVWRLCQNVPSNTLVAFDNFFTNCNLLDDLFSKDIYAVGTVRVNRKDLPDIFKNTDRKNKLQKHEFAALTAGPITAIKWVDTRDVTVLSTAHKPRDVMFVKRTQKDGSKSNIMIPKAIAEYTMTMGGVDHFDHFRSSYPINRKSRKFWMRLFLFMFDASIINSYITYTTLHSAMRHSHRDYRLRLARGLISDFTTKKRKPVTFKNKRGGNFGVPDEVRLTNVGVHLPIKDNSYKRCRFCSTKQQEKRTYIKCSFCGVSLCAQSCFKDYHLAESL